MKRNTLLTIFIVTSALAKTAAAQIPDPAVYVQAFYAFEMKAPQSFDKRNLVRRQKWLSPRLYDLFRAELRKQNAHLKTHPDDKPFFGDGFPFRPIDEVCDSNGRSYKRQYRVQAGKTRSGQHTVTVRFSYPKPCGPMTIIYRLKLIRAGSRWLIDDVIFDDGSSLSAAMREHRY